MSSSLAYISVALPEWYAENARQLPWRENKDPYRVWLSEIMLQQTRVEAVIGYYERFLSVLPDVSSLANVNEDVLLKLWEGLGYYNRVRNLQKAAGIIMEKYGGHFPRRYEDILSLPGIGVYTAGAIGSICFGLPTPAVDGNVLRVISRFLEDSRVIDLEQTKKSVRELLLPVYNKAEPSVITQGLMELGACVCIPNGAPKCGQCPLKFRCRCFLHKSWEDYPKRALKKKRQIIYKTVLVLKCGDDYAIRKRDKKGLLADLWEFPNEDLPPQLQKELIKKGAEAQSDPATAIQLANDYGVQPKDVLKMLRYTHVFTHVEWRMTAWFFMCGNKTSDFLWVTKNNLKETYALPSAFRPFLDEILC